MSYSARYDDYLSTYKFYPNSIQFRIQSSKAIEKFKNVQSFQLNQLINGKFFFARDRRELLLLKYDMWSRWIYEVENFCIELSGKSSVISSKEIDHILDLAVKTTETYESVINIQHKNAFDANFTKIWLETHQLSFEFFVKLLRKLNGLRYDTFFMRVIDIIVQQLQYTLTEIHELDSLFCKRNMLCAMCSIPEDCSHAKHCESLDETPFMIFGNMESSYYGETGKCLVVERLKIYSKYFDIHEIYFKNYTDESLDEFLIQRVEDIGIKIDYKKCLIKM